MEQTFQIQHLALRIDDPAGLAVATIEKLLGLFRRPGQSGSRPPGAMMLEVHGERRREAHREHLPRIWQGALDGVALAVYRRGGRRRIELPGRAVLDFDVERLWAQLCLPERTDAAAAGFLLLRLVCDSLTRGGHSFLHAACLAAPRRGGWAGVVLSAPSNTGKTTTALALAGSGWRLLGDDITYVRPPHLGSAVWGFPRSCHVRPGTLGLLPWLRELELGPPAADGVRTLPPAALGQRAWPAGPWLPPGLVVALAPPNRRATRIEPIDRAEALSCIGGESINAAPGVCDEDGARDFVTLGRLVCAAPACRLSVGPTVDDVASRLEEFLSANAAAAAPRRGMGRQRAA